MDALLLGRETYKQERRHAHPVCHSAGKVQPSQAPAHGPRAERLATTPRISSRKEKHHVTPVLAAKLESILSSGPPCPAGAPSPTGLHPAVRGAARTPRCPQYLGQTKISKDSYIAGIHHP